MGIRYRKSVNLGPLRINFSKSGVGYSVGGKGYRVTKTATGQVRRTASIPGTGISHVTTTSAKKVAEEKEAKRREKEARKAARPKRRLWPWILAGVLLLLFLLIPTGCSADDPGEIMQAAVSTASPASSKPVSVPEPEPEPEPVVPEPAPVPEPEPNREQSPAPEPDPTSEPEATKEISQTYIGNKNSKVFHELSCKSVSDMKDKNKVTLADRDQAVSRGFKPCGNCKP